MTEILYRDPAELKLHPLQKVFPEPDQDSDEWGSFVDGLMGAGPDNIPPIIITEAGQIMDGARRWRAAKQLQWRRIRCEERPADLAALLMIESICGQRDLPRATKAYMAVCLQPEFITGAEARRVSNLRQGTKIVEKPLIFPKPSNLASGIQQLCDRLGFSDETYRRARAVHELFGKKPDLKAELEPLLLSGKKNLWNVLSGVAGADPDHQKHRQAGIEATQLELFTDAAGAIAKVGKSWLRLGEPRRREIVKLWRDTVVRLPKELRREMIEALNAEEESE